MEDILASDGFSFILKPHKIFKLSFSKVSDLTTDFNCLFLKIELENRKMLCPFYVQGEDG